MCRWCKQYEKTKTRDIPAMDFLMDHLNDNLPQNERVSVIHGDFRYGVGFQSKHCLTTLHSEF